MNSGLYAACAGLVARTDSLDAIANNLANTSTAGFRGRQGSFSSVLAQTDRHPLGSVLNQVTNNYGVLGATRMDPTQGSLTATGNSMDFAIQGPGYFAVETASGTQYTRNGAFRVSPTGQLTTQTGEAVLGRHDFCERRGRRAAQDGRVQARNGCSERGQQLLYGSTYGGANSDGVVSAPGNAGELQCESGDKRRGFD